MGKDDKKKPAAVKKKNTYHMNKCYTVSGSTLDHKNRSCPKCGDGFLMAEHKDRRTCGKCSYMEKK
ncbi:30S ribosomal protein S27ae [Candidatus Woesearchaeota archaeon CG11_big_fil_rev_8_21_14_0_20_43_8]|nr:MAG: 30S ribosomal protein S27ae [Candidatus Woesearchaeota archaeon CG11_big_fil_rev_8_21_14_0_20_43_8]PIO04813.1 MAG: 30S ribosomal protein S27ae [Candidatus Woesearchaeota archaeon CG08_land_8_20_14_0_20_43_7]